MTQKLASSIAILSLLAFLLVTNVSLAKEVEPGDDRGSDVSSEVTSGMPVPGSDVDEMIVEIEDEMDDVGEVHRSEVAKAVQGLLDASDRAGGIGEEVREIAKEQEEAHEHVADAMSKASKRSTFIRFIIGPDYSSLGELRSSLVTSENGIERLTKARDKASDASVKAELDTEIAKLKMENEHAMAFLEDQEDTVSLFGWLLKMLSGS